MQQQVESYKMALRDWEEQQQRYRSALQARAAAAAAAAAHNNTTSTASTSPNEANAVTISSNSDLQQQHSTVNSVAARTWERERKRSVCEKKIPSCQVLSWISPAFWSEKSKIRRLAT